MYQQKQHQFPSRVDTWLTRGSLRDSLPSQCMLVSRVLVDRHSRHHAWQHEGTARSGGHTEQDSNEDHHRYRCSDPPPLPKFGGLGSHLLRQGAPGQGPRCGGSSCPWPCSLGGGRNSIPNSKYPFMFTTKTSADPLSGGACENTHVSI